MISDHRCFYCFTRAFEKLLEKESISEEKKSSFTLEMVSLYLERRNDFSAPLFSRELHHILGKYTNNYDPYKTAKKENNDHALSLFPDLRNIILQSNDKFTTALRFAVAGNIIDFAACDNFDLQATIEKALNSQFAIDHSEQLKIKIRDAKKILYLGDNAGEIVLDKLFIGAIKHPDLTFAVRGAPIINDATMEDAEYTGITEIADVISNGYDAPSTIPEKSDKLFQKYFKEADLIISKGQGNLEGLYPLNDDRIFYLLMVKCDVIAEFLKVKKGSFVVFNPKLT
jgi:damage-control phosphatase, subfamily I